jgi:DNA-binding NarL/FixJ family response regulator
VFRSGVVALLSRERTFGRSRACLQTLLTQVAELKPQVALVDVDLAVSGGLEAIARIAGRRRRSPSRSQRPDRELVLPAVRAGARGIIERTVRSRTSADAEPLPGGHASRACSVHPG